jgi:hypothetical protein
MLAGNVIEHAISLPTGKLLVSACETDFTLDELAGFAARNNPRRGFLFVSKVLGKHIPVRPSAMRHVQDYLASRLLQENIQRPVFIGMAETATGLGHGIYESFIEQRSAENTLYIHSTRYYLSRQRIIEFQETHSHATDIYLYLPADRQLKTSFLSAKTLILIDDEISTGSTFIDLIRAYRVFNPKLEQVFIVSILNFTDPLRQREIARQAGLPVRFVYVLEGCFSFTPDPAYEFNAIVNVTGNDKCKQALVPSCFGRLGLCGKLSLDLAALDPFIARWPPGARLLVLGTGEFMHPVFRIGDHLEQRGFDTFVQSTTRSPILLGGAIQSVIAFRDNYADGIPNFLYNVNKGDYDQILVGYETVPCEDLHALVHELNAIRIDLHDGKIFVS